MRLEMQVVSLDTGWEPVFWEHVNQDIPHYYFFVLDWEYNQDETEILLAVTGRKIDGMMLTYQERIVQFRGNLESGRLLLEHLDLEEVELQAPREHREIILEMYEPTRSHELMLMLLGRGEERLHITHPIVKLTTSDAEQIVAIMNQADPENWGDVTLERIIDGMGSVKWTGIEVDGEPVSICGTRLTDE